MDIQKGIQYIKLLMASYLGWKHREGPQILSYLVTNQCNSHCITCSVWKDKESQQISLDKLEEIVKNALFRKIRHVGISGGEPSLSTNLLDQIGILVKGLPSIATLSITSNCIRHEYLINHIKEIEALCKEKGIHFQLNISLDGVGKIHDMIRGTKGNFFSTVQVIQFVKENKIPYQLHCTVNKYNVYHVNQILNFAKKMDADIIFRLASVIERLYNNTQIERIQLNDQQKSFFCDFLSSRTLLEYTKSPGRKLFYRHLVVQLLNNGPRTAPCYFKHQGLVLSANGGVSFCSRFKTDFASVYSDDNLMQLYNNQKIFDTCSGNACVNCMHDQTGLWPLHEVLSLYLSDRIISMKKIIEVSKNLLQSFMVSRKKVTDFNPSCVDSIGIIGMYGGEHVGDAAILGGVICRVLERYQTIKTIYVYSFRKDRTVCWGNNLTEISSDVEIKVLDDRNKYCKFLKECQLIVWAGGPLMELPVVLSRNFVMIQKALSYGCKFEMEGIGYGPINTRFGNIMTANILNKATRITVRSKEDLYKLESKNVKINIQKINDPAFDYLKKIPQALRLDKDVQQEVDKLLLIDKEQKIMALNLRPLWSRYGNQSTFDYNLFIEEIVKTIKILSDHNIVTVFFPMNADQYGFSDLDVAYAIKEKIAVGSMFRIWETEASINSLIYLLRHVDFTLCMRFHAAIFSLSQNLTTYAIDYSLNGKGKVSTLFKENIENCISIKDYNAETVSDKILSSLK